MDVSVIIVNYNTSSLTLQCINSLISHTSRISYEIIVVDNHSQDNSYDVLSKVKGITYIYLDSNLGFGAANNIGISKSTGKYVFFLNSDTILLNNALEILYDFINKSPDNIAGVGAYLLNLDNARVHSGGDFPSLINQISFLDQLYNQQKINYTKPYSIDYITGADLLVRRCVIDKHGAFDENFFMYYEETDMQKRYHNAGYKFILVPDADIIHLEGGSFSSEKKLPINKLIMQLKSRYLYFKKNSSKTYYFFFRILYSIIMFVPILRLKCTKSEKTKYLNTLFFYKPIIK